MSDWLIEYSSALDIRDSREKANESTISSYTRMADRTARLEAEVAAAPPPSNPSSPNPGTKSKSPLGRGSTRSPVNAGADPTGPQDLLNRLRADLANTQNSRAALQSQVSNLAAELKALKQKSTADTRTITDLSRSIASLERKVRDRDSEIKGKGRLVEDVQDELVSLNLQFNMAEQKSDRLEKENKELLDRYMARIESEADQMNDEHEIKR